MSTKDFSYERGIVARCEGNCASELTFALDNLCGDYVNDGSWRNVYVHKQDPGRVIKLEGISTFAYESPFHNWREAAVWNRVKADDNLARWFLPVVGTSRHGWWLVQQRAPHSMTWDEFEAAEKAGTLAGHHARCDRLRAAMEIGVPDFILANRYADVRALRNWSLGTGNQPVIHDYADVSARDLPHPGAQYDLVPVKFDMHTADFKAA